MALIRDMDLGDRCRVRGDGRPYPEGIENPPAAVRQRGRALVEARLRRRIVTGTASMSASLDTETVERHGEARADHAATDDGDVEGCLAS